MDRPGPDELLKAINRWLDSSYACRLGLQEVHLQNTTEASPAAALVSHHAKDLAWETERLEAVVLELQHAVAIDDEVNFEISIPRWMHALTQWEGSLISLQMAAPADPIVDLQSAPEGAMQWAGLQVRDHVILCARRGLVTRMRLLSAAGDPSPDEMEDTMQPSRGGGASCELRH